MVSGKFSLVLICLLFVLCCKAGRLHLTMAHVVIPDEYYEYCQTKLVGMIAGNMTRL